MQTAAIIPDNEIVLNRVRSFLRCSARRGGGDRVPDDVTEPENRRHVELFCAAFRIHVGLCQQVVHRRLVERPLSAALQHAAQKLAPMKEK